MAHNNYQQMMSLSLDGLLPEPEEAVLLAHLDTCAACSATWDAMTGLDNLFKAVTMANPPRDFTAGVMARVEAHNVRRRWFETLVWLALAALAVSAVVLDPLSAANLASLPEPLASALMPFAPMLEALRTFRAGLSVMAEGLRLWLGFVASLPAAQIMGVVALVLMSTWLGLVGLFGADQMQWSGAENTH